ncbi:MAG: class I SAM-dependent methyltransferase [Brevundimonas sp.]|uniref:class I SAM-dependent methyltransferase n=1 Tax=Brevundimonas sp. TaxID=1871086 RepID=UPI0027349BA4|nr:class I SAM-dependent methyltransferase [Brevundimonas sp.]MDP3405797.1 class I SAM-dependent methyltransferase [Brevundimonas sp.]
MTASFTPALGHAALSGLYDPAIALLTRERVWRARLLDQVAPKPGETIIDLGCGTGSFAVSLAQRAPGARIIGLDPDGDILRRAEAKAVAAGLDIHFVEGFSRDVAAILGDGVADKMVSSLVFHQLPMEEKRRGLAASLRALKPGGTLHIADYGRQAGPMRLLFRMVQSLDGYENTQPNADGILPRLIGEAGFTSVRESSVLTTPTGSISFYHAEHPHQGSV